MSDVVQKPMPFTLTFNEQQFSKDTKFFWYYNWPSIAALEPDRGPEAGGTSFNLIGRNFYPFKDELKNIDNS